MSRRLSALALLCAIILTPMLPARALSQTVILRLRAAAQSQYADPGDRMNTYCVYVYRGKAYATTRGLVKGVATIAVWEYVPDQWHRIFDFPASDAHAPEVTQRWRSYGFNAAQEKRLLASPRAFPY